jgi:hypothetical protein
MIDRLTGENAKFPDISKKIPIPIKSEFDLFNTNCIFALIRISEIKAGEPDLSYNQVIMVLPPSVYGMVVNHGLVWTEVSSQIESYLKEAPQVADFISEHRQKGAITEFGKIVGPVPNYTDWVKKRS